MPVGHASVVVVRRTGSAVRHEGRPRPLVARADGGGRPPTCPPEPLDAEHPLFILYTSGTTGQAEGRRAHHRAATCCRRALTTQVRVRPASEDDTYWCTADIGWVTGHSYVVYGPLANGATTLMYEGAPNIPSRTASGASSSGTSVSVFYTAPTAIRAFVRWGDAVADEARPLEPAPAGHGRASRSTPRPGCGTAA